MLRISNLSRCTSSNISKQCYNRLFCWNSISKSRNLYISNNSSNNLKRFYSTDPIKNLIYYRDDNNNKFNQEKREIIGEDDYEEDFNDEYNEFDGELPEKDLDYNKFDNDHLDYDQIDNNSDILAEQLKEAKEQKPTQSLKRIDEEIKFKLLESYRESINLSPTKENNIEEEYNIENNNSEAVLKTDKASESITSSRSIESILEIENFRTRIKVLLENGYFKIVMEAFNQSLNVHPDHRQDVYHLIELIVKFLILKDQYPKAERFLLNAVTLHPAFLESNNALSILRDLRYFDPSSKFIQSLLNTHVIISQEQLMQLINIYLSVSDSTVINQLVSRLHATDDSPQPVYERLIYMAIDNNAFVITQHWIQSFIIDMNITPTLPMFQHILMYMISKDRPITLIKRLLFNRDYYSIAVLIAYNELKSVGHVQHDQLAKSIVKRLYQRDGDRVSTLLINIYLQLGLFDNAIEWYVKRISMFNLPPNSSIIDLFISYLKKNKLDSNNNNISIQFWQQQSEMLHFSKDHIRQQHRLNSVKQRPPLELFSEIYSMESGGKELYLKGMLPKDWMYIKEQQQYIDDLLATEAAPSIDVSQTKLQQFPQWVQSKEYKHVSGSQLMNACCYYLSKHLEHAKDIISNLPSEYRCIFINSFLFKNLAKLRLDDAISLLRLESDKTIYQNEVLTSIVVEELYQQGHVELATQILLDPNCRITENTLDVVCNVFIDYNIYPEKLLYRMQKIYPSNISILNVHLNNLIHNNQLEQAKNYYQSIMSSTTANNSNKKQRYNINNSNSNSNYKTILLMIKCNELQYPDVKLNLNEWQYLIDIAKSPNENSLDIRHSLYNTMFRLLDPKGLGENIDVISALVEGDPFYFLNEDYKEMHNKSNAIQQYTIICCKNDRQKLKLFLDCRFTLSKIALDSVNKSNSKIQNEKVNKKIKLQLESSAVQPNIKVQQSKSSTKNVLNRYNNPSEFSALNQNFIVKHYLLPMLEQNEKAIRRINLERKMRLRKDIRSKPWKYNKLKFARLPGATNPFVYRVDSKVLKDIPKVIE